jgi:alpha-mannosidase
VKKAEDSDAVIVRMYEYFNRRTKAVLRTGFPLKSASVCNIMEEDDTPAEVNGDEVFFEMRPYEIKTLKLEF